jgi:hypothetical protein
MQIEPFVAFAGNTKIKCPKCGNRQMKEGYDPCLGKIPGVTKACCGHGNDQPYLHFENGWTMQFWKDNESLYFFHRVNEHNTEGFVFSKDGKSCVNVKGVVAKICGN